MAIVKASKYYDLMGLLCPQPKEIRYVIDIKKIREYLRFPPGTLITA